MKRVFIHGVGCVSPAGWDLPSFRAALASGQPVPPAEISRPPTRPILRHRPVPPVPARQPFLAHGRLRRSGPLTVFAAAAAYQALDGFKRDGRRLGIIFCVTGGCVQFSRRFYDETWRNPATASPLVFPETVFNAPSSHLSALFDSSACNYTCVGDPAVILQAVAMAAAWIVDGKVDDCLVVGAEEADWLTSDAWRHFHRGAICGEGSGALLLSALPSEIELACVTPARLYLHRSERASALAATRAALPSPGSNDLLCDSRSGVPVLDHDEDCAWVGWPGMRLSPKRIFGEGLAAGAAWQCVAAIDALRQGAFPAATVAVAGTHEHAAAARFVRLPA